MGETLREIFRELDPRHDFDFMRNSPDERLLPTGMYRAVKPVARGGVAGMLVGVFAGVLTDTPLALACARGAYAGVAMDELVYVVRLGWKLTMKRLDLE